MAAPQRAAPAPPKLAPKPGKVEVVRAMYHYEAQLADELTFEEGDLLYIIDKSNPDWWKAKCGNKTGLIPSNYVESNTEAVDNPLHEAAKRGNISFLQECLDNRVSVNGLDKAGNTPLHWAAHSGNADCLQLLLKSPGCQVNVQNKLGDTPLHSAAWRSQYDCVQLLLDSGAVTDIRNNEKKLPYDLAKDVKVAGLLQQAALASRQRAQSNEYYDEDGEGDD